MPQDNEDTDTEVEEKPARKTKPEQGPSARPNDIPLQKPALANSTFGTRTKRVVATAENKAVNADDDVTTK